MTDEAIKIAKRKAAQSVCHYKVSALGFNKRGEIICCLNNRPRFTRYGGGLHAEMRVVANYPSVHTILLVRIGEKGKLLPIHPCSRCQKILNKLKVKVVTAL